MIERALQALLWAANLLLWAAYAIAWNRHSLTERWGAASPIRLHLATAGLSVMFAFFALLFIIFYFVGTGLWIKEQAQRARVPQSAQKLLLLYREANRLKGAVFPFATLAILCALFTFIFGGAIQVGALPHWAHPALATGLVFFTFYTALQTRRAMKANVEFLDRASQELDASR